MAKPLTNEVPSSAVARLLEPGIGRAALAEAPAKPEAPVQSAGEVPNVKREFILTQSTDETLTHMTSLLSKATGTDVSNSHFLRVLLKVLEGARPEIEKQAWAVGSLKRPSNARGKERDRERYEEALARALGAGLGRGAGRETP